MAATSTESLSPTAPVTERIDRRRYRRVVGFFARAFGHALVHDALLALPVLRLARRPAIPRWCAIARRYRALAVALGGVLIKLGQFLSARVDVLPIEVVRELAELQDEVPPAPFERVRAQIEADLGRPLEATFAHIEPRAMGAASLAQAHEATLRDGRRVVVKVLRPGIDVLVETDLKAIGLAIRWLKVWRFVRRRVDLDWLIEEFTATTRAELDLAREADNAERFARDFAGHPVARFPAVIRETSGRRTLTEENVAFIKVSDLAALDAAGVDRAAVAKALYQVYLQQVFSHHFVHADPHPGNLFVRPVDTADRAGGEGDEGPGFELYFIDFGMVAEVPQRLRAGLRDYIVGVGNRDAGAVIRAYVKTGILLPGADLEKLEEALEAAFDRFWGVEMSRIGDLARREAMGLWREFGRLVLDTPIQLPADLLFATRAFELLNGVATALDPDFNPWAETTPFARALAAEVAPALGEAVWHQLQQVAGLPVDAARLARQARRGRLSVRMAFSPETKRYAERLERAVDRVGAAVLAGALLIAGALLYPHQIWLAGGLMLAAAGIGLWAVVRRLLL